MADAVSVQQHGHVAVLEVHRPPANFFDVDILATLADLGASLSADGRTRAIVLCSEGKHFCAGANFSSGGLGEERVAESRRIYMTAQRLFTIPIPMVAAVQGSAVGGGLGLACAADFRVASPSTRFHANFATLGFHQGFGLSVSLARIVGEQLASRLLLTSERVTGERAVQIGLADVLVEDGVDANASVRASALQLAQRLAEQAPLAVASMRKTLRGDLADRVAEILERELSEQARLWQTKDCAEGIAANLERRTPAFEGQ